MTMEIIAQAKTESFTVFSNIPALTIENKLAIIESLQETLDLKDLMNNFAALVAKFVRPFNIQFQSPHGFFNLKNNPKAHYKKSYNLSLSSSAHRIGSITYQSDMPIEKSEDKVLHELHELVLTSLKHALKFSELNSMIFKDHLTNISNRAYYDETIQRSIEQCYRNQQSLSLILLDANDFKIINDTLGHLAGDKVLQIFAQIMIKSIRTSDMVFRLGGDEFAIILEPGGVKSVENVTNRIRQEIENDVFLRKLKFSSSIGFSHWQMGMTNTELFSAADQNLYMDKALGKRDK